jgi:hypothetical protein
MAQFANPFSLRGGMPGVLNEAQLNPIAQAAMQGFGISPLGGETGIAPDSGLTQDFLNRWIDTRQGKEVDLSQRRSFSRFFGSLLRSVPQVRLGEMAIPTSGVPHVPLVRGTGGRPAYPESIPFLKERPIPVREESRRNLANPFNLFMAYTGLATKNKDLARYQSTLRKSTKFGKTKLKRQLKNYGKGVSK